MKHLFRSMALLCAVSVGSVVVAGCVSNKTIDTYEARLKALEDGGAPDSLLSTIRVYISQAKAGKKSGNSMLVRANVDSAKVYLAAAEKWYQEQMRASKQQVDSLNKYFTEKKVLLSGVQQKEADSLMTIINSYCTKNQYLQAFDYAGRLDTLMPSLLKDEEVAKKTSAELLGTTWAMNKKHTEDGANALEKSTVSFKKDGTFDMSEEMNGQTKPALKEDWLFLTSGVYAVKADTILLSTQKEQCVRQIYWHLNNKNAWVKTEKKPYDTIIKDGSKDRFLTLDYIKDNFKKSK